MALVNAGLPRTLTPVIGGCPHTAADFASGVNSISTPISLLESTRCSQVDFMALLGDISANQNPTEIATYATEGVNAALQLNSGAYKIPRSRIYTLMGNHDSGDGNRDWYDRYVDPHGLNTAYSGVVAADRPYPISTDYIGKDYYHIQTGNIFWLFLDDVNYGAQPCGRSGGTGGFPSGSTTLEAYNWWVSMIEDNPGKIIITLAHHSLKNTTIATGDNEGVNGGFHGSTGQAVGSGRLHNVITDIALNTYEADQTRFMDYLAANPGACTIWFCSHSHTYVDDTYAGRGIMETVNGCVFYNVGGMTAHHAARHPQLKVLNFVENSTTLSINNFLLDTSYAPTGYQGDTTTIILPFAYTP